MPAWTGLDPGGREVQGFGVAGAPRGHEHGVHAEPAAGVEFQGDVPVFVRLAAGHPVLPEELDAELPVHGLLQRTRHLVVEERQQLLAAVDDPDVGPQRGERAGVLAADDPRADDGQRPGQPIELEDRVGVEHPRVVEGEPGRPDRRGAGGDQDRLGRAAGARWTGRGRGRYGGRGDGRPPRPCAPARRSGREPRSRPGSCADPGTRPCRGTGPRRTATGSARSACARWPRPGARGT